MIFYFGDKPLQPITWLWLVPNRTCSNQDKHKKPKDNYTKPPKLSTTHDVLIVKRWKVQKSVIE